MNKKYNCWVDNRGFIKVDETYGEMTYTLVYSHASEADEEHWRDLCFDEDILEYKLLLIS